MTIKKCVDVVMYGVYMLYGALEDFNIPIIDGVSISMLEFLTGLAIASIVVIIVTNFSWGS